MFFKLPPSIGRAGDTGRNYSITIPSVLPISFSAVRGLGTGRCGELGRGCSASSHTTRQASLVFLNQWDQPAQGGPGPATAGESKSKQAHKEHFFYSSLLLFSTM